MRIGIFYGSTTGVTKRVAERAGELLGADVMNAAEIEEKIDNYDMLIFATSSWNRGDVQKSWESHLKFLGGKDFGGRKIALIGVGDQEFFGKTFVEGMNVIYTYIKYNNIKLIGRTSTNGYDFEESRSVEKGKFIGLAIDDKNQKELTEERIENWVKQLKEEIKD